MEPHHTKFLRYDSFIECKLPISITEYDLEQSIKSRGIIGTVHQSLASAIYAEVKINEAISADDKKAIGLALVGPRNL
jgi:hypothetical protein